MKKIGLMLIVLGFVLFFINLYTDLILSKSSAFYALIIMIGSSIVFVKEYRDSKNTKDTPTYIIKSLISLLLIILFSGIWITVIIREFYF